MPRPAIETRTAELRAARVPYVHARVVLAEKPTSATPGDEALVLADGTIEGFVGGMCAESTVRDHALQALAAGEALLLRITPAPEDAGSQAGKAVAHNPCLSGGSFEVFLQPELPAPVVVVQGSAPIADALLRVGAAVGYEVRAFDGAVPADATAVVVASHGRDEEVVLTEALRAGVPYVGLVASPTRGKAVVAALDVDDADRDRVDCPAGLDLGARTPEEVAVSILASIIAARPLARVAVPEPREEELGGTATDPVCGMTVVRVEGSLHVEHAGDSVWFCGSGCQAAFLADPAAFGG
jgi:xanthine dehydrogenase accessory factor